jgi:hypothetical protein
VQTFSLDITTPLATLLPDLAEDAIRKAGGRKHVGERQQAIVSLLLTSYEGRRKHSRYPHSTSFPRDELARRLRASKNGAIIPKLLQPFFQFEAGNRGYSKSGGETKAYTLHPHVVDAIAKVLYCNSPLGLVGTDEAGASKAVAIGELPANGVPEELTDKLFLPSIISIASDTLDKTRRWINSAIADCGTSAPLDIEKPSGTTLADAYRQLRKIERWHGTAGGIPNFYTEQTHGRLGPATDSHIVSMPRILRQLLLQDSGLTDYDIRSCNWSLYLSRARSLNIETKLAEGYLAAKDDVHAMLAGITGHSNMDDWKAVLLSWLTGASLSGSSRTTAGRLTGSDAMQKVAANSSLSGLYKELRAGMREIVSRVERRRSKTTGVATMNAVGKACVLKGDTSDFGRMCAHELAGLEQFAIREMCAQAVGVQAIIYDGLLAQPQAVAPLIERVRLASIERLGFPLTLELKATELSAREPYTPAPEPYSSDPWDF